jgi:hypothetical protein
VRPVGKGHTHDRKLVELFGESYRDDSLLSVTLLLRTVPPRLTTTLTTDPSVPPRGGVKRFSWAMGAGGIEPPTSRV